jgi:CRISPR-associated protein Csx10
MGCWSLELELIDELILSQRAASLGGHRSLDRIPGATLLGAAAATLYQDKDLGRRNAWTVFHSGKVRFGDGLPVSAGTGAMGWPVPLCWHHAKGESVVETGRFKAERLFNLMHTGGKLPGDDSDRQPKQLRDIYVTVFGERVRPETEFRMRTAIDPRTGRAADAQLFGFESLRAGQRFLASLEWDDDVSEEAVEKLQAFFAGRELLLGRSRSAQFGRVRCILKDTAAFLPETVEPKGAEITLWLLSDLAVCDENGAPTLTPSSVNLGLPVGEPVPEKTYTRFRAYAPYNGYQKLFGRERQIIAAGSVLTFKLSRTPTAEEWAALRKTLAGGLGLYRESGLGRCVLEPALLREVNPDFRETKTGISPSTDTPRTTARPDHPYAHWLEWIASGRDAEAERKQWAEQAAKALDQLERNARALNGLADDKPASPGKSQWGRVAEEAKSAAQSDDAYNRLHAALFDTDSGVCKPGSAQEDWHLPTQWQDSEGRERSGTFADWLHERFAERAADASVALGLLANLAQKRLTTREGR